MFIEIYTIFPTYNANKSPRSTGGEIIHAERGHPMLGYHRSNSSRIRDEADWRSPRVASPRNRCHCGDLLCRSGLSLALPRSLSIARPFSRRGKPCWVAWGAGCWRHGGTCMIQQIMLPFLNGEILSSGST